MCLPRGSPENGSAAIVDQAGDLRLRDSSLVRSPAGVLAGKFTMARQIFVGIDRGAAAGAAAHRSWILRAVSDGPAGAAWQAVAGGVRPRIGVYLWRTGDRVGHLQPPLFSAAAGVCVRRRPSKIVGSFGRARRVASADLFAGGSPTVGA